MKSAQMLPTFERLEGNKREHVYPLIMTSLIVRYKSLTTCIALFDLFVITRKHQIKKSQLREQSGFQVQTFN